MSSIRHIKLLEFLRSIPLDPESIDFILDRAVARTGTLEALPLIELRHVLLDERLVRECLEWNGRQGVTTV